MAYQQNIPQPTDLLSQSQQDILGNFQGIYTLVNVNHGNFDTANQGKHLFVSLPEQAMAPGTLADEAAIYSAVGVGSGVTELVFQRENNGPTYAFTESGNNALGWTRLPSGLMMRWGVQTVAAGPPLHTFANLFVAAGSWPGFATAVYTVQITSIPSPAPAVDSGNMVLLSSFTVTDLSVLSVVRGGAANTFGACSFNYLAIGI